MINKLTVGGTQNASKKVTSLEVLEQVNLFRKQEGNRAVLQHSDLLKLIRDEFEDEILLGNISEKSLPSTGGRPTKIYELSLSQAKQILMRESKFVRKAVIHWIDELEKAIEQGAFRVPQTFREALMLAAQQQEEIEEKQRQIKAQSQQLTEQAPKVLFADAIVGSTTSCLIGELAKIITQNGVVIGQNRLFAWLRDKGYLGRSGERYNLPNQRYIEQGLFEIKKGSRSGEGGVMKTTLTPKVTPKGQLYFVNHFLLKASKEFTNSQNN